LTQKPKCHLLAQIHRAVFSPSKRRFQPITVR
jgi:hypothetical protein